MLMGFPKENLLTERSRKTWQLWRETMSTDDWWGPGLASPNFKFPDTGGDITELQQQLIEKMEKLAAKIGIEPEFRMAAIERVLKPPTGTINCSSINEKGEMSSATTTSGLAWKIAGRAGDSPIIGAGCYCDQDVGAAGATGNGEENIKVCGGAHHRREHAPRHVARRGRHGRPQAHRPQLQRRHAQAGVHGHDVLHPAQRRRLCGRVVVGGPARSSPALRGARRQGQALREGDAAVPGSLAGLAAHAGRPKQAEAGSQK